MTSPPTSESPTPTRTLSVASDIAFVVLAVIQALISLLLGFGVLLAQFAFDACSDHTCNYALGTVSMWMGWIGIVLAAAVTAAVAVFRARGGRLIWWAPFVGSGVAIAFTVLSYLLTTFAAAAPHR